MQNYFGASQLTNRFLVIKQIVNVMIRDKLWEPEYTNGRTHAEIMRSFEDFSDETKALQEGK